MKMAPVFARFFDAYPDIDSVELLRNGTVTLWRNDELYLEPTEHQLALIVECLTQAATIIDSYQPVQIIDEDDDIVDSVGGVQ